MDFIGIDVGEGKYFVTWYSEPIKRIQAERFFSCAEIFKFLESKLGVTAVDAPSGPRSRENRRRKCEEDLGIGGYFATPFEKELAKPWMQSGFELWEFLKERNFRRAVFHPTKPGDLIEVHPTVIFKKMLNQDLLPRQWIGSRQPVSKGRSKGKKQRREILKKGFPGQDEVIDRLNIDYVDALIGTQDSDFYP